jgi:hypothetical protein
MRVSAVFASAAAFGLFVFAAPANQKWMEKDYNSWTPDQAQQMLLDSPWARRAGAIIQTQAEDPATKDIPLPRPANVPDPGPTYKSDSSYGVDDGQWDGGVAGRSRRGEPQKIPVMVRWDSARPIREALLKTHAPELLDTQNTIAQLDKDYVITVQGLAPARRPPDPESEDRQGDAAPYDLRALRVAFLNASRLLRSGKKPLAPEDVHLDEKTGTLQIFFPKSDPITLSDKVVVFRTTFGNLKVVQGFRLKDMTRKGELEL